MQTRGSHYLRELFLSIGLYSVVLIGSIWVLNTYPNIPFRVVIALLPMLPALLIPVVVARQLRRLDELQRQIQLEALGFAFATTAVLTFGYGFLERVGFPAMGGFAVWPIMAASWLIGLWVGNRRFR